ncbi:hypothetical protein LJN56_10725 [Cellulomonas sp. zg-Y908]|uniref:Uncharacterized protein n=1 Tax=Cellulomonas wangsupingiae TaxID=2968085 RepID=A0ABY5K8X6_9CELL|nr:hypothetical protein [Cellulomonas wangsupingiae]MCC2335076.1 hypothetical protein [Cellulomonas wangsupingiae]UUI65572.1 hypothetical protein NP075_02195 [Cellulomonas wangsupingiae]
MSPDAVDPLLRHFAIETNPVNFIIRNTPVGIEPVTLRPESLSELGDQAVVEHDVNVYDVLVALDVVPLVARDPLDFRQLTSRRSTPSGTAGDWSASTSRRRCAS